MKKKWKKSGFTRQHEIVCPYCSKAIDSVQFESHVRKKHKVTVEDAFAVLEGDLTSGALRSRLDIPKRGRSVEGGAPGLGKRR